MEPLPFPLKVFAVACYLLAAILFVWTARGALKETPMRILFALGDVVDYAISLVSWPFRRHHNPDDMVVENIVKAWRRSRSLNSK